MGFWGMVVFLACFVCVALLAGISSDSTPSWINTAIFFAVMFLVAGLVDKFSLGVKNPFKLRKTSDDVQSIPESQKAEAMQSFLADKEPAKLREIRDLVGERLPTGYEQELNS